MAHYFYRENVPDEVGLEDCPHKVARTVHDTEDECDEPASCPVICTDCGGEVGEATLQGNDVSARFFDADYRASA